MDKRKNNLAKKFSPRSQSVLNDNEVAQSAWRVFKIMGEFVSGFEFLNTYDAAATFFGSARLKPDNKFYQEAEKLGRDLAQLGFAIITGGGPGIMEAGNKGAYQSGGVSVGFNIQLPSEQRSNQYITSGKAFNYFFIRKVMMSYASELYIFFPGGFGTLDEFFEILTLVQTKKICKLPIILIDKGFWQPLLDWHRKTLYQENKTVSKEDLELYHLVNDADEALAHIKKLIKNNQIQAKELPVEYSEGLNIQKVEK